MYDFNEQNELIETIRNLTEALENSDQILKWASKHHSDIKVPKIDILIKNSTNLINSIESPSWAKWKAIDLTGEIFVYANKPDLSYNCWESEGRYRQIGQCDYETSHNWETSLEPYGE